MKKVITLLLLCITLHSVTKAQCDKNVIITASKTEYIDSSGNLERSQEENSILEITRQEVKIIPGDEENLMTGKIKSIVCNWKVPYKDGKTIIKTDLLDKRGDLKTATITIQGKDGKLTLLFEVKEFPNRKIRLNIERFEEK